MQPESTGVLTATDLLATADAIEAQQLANGLILWFEGGHADVWNHVESAMALDAAGHHDAAARAYRWLVDAQHGEGWWHHFSLANGIEDAKVDTNCCAYLATGVWHRWLITGDRGVLEAMWPVVEAAIEFVIGMQTPRGEIPWARHTDGTPWSYALLTGSSSTCHSLGCAVRIAETLGLERPDWELAGVRLSDVITTQPDAFAPKHRWAMDWYYPVLTGVVRGDAALAATSACGASQTATGSLQPRRASALWPTSPPVTATRPLPSSKRCNTCATTTAPTSPALPTPTRSTSPPTSALLTPPPP